MLLALICPACLLDRTIAMVRADAGERADGGWLDGGMSTPAREWGRTVGAMTLPACVDGGVLIVNTTDDSLEGGPTISTRDEVGAYLSFREALFIASNTPGADIIQFDENTFPQDNPATILVTDDSLEFPPAPLTDTCIDAQRRGVTLRFAYATSTRRCAGVCTWALGAGSLMKGLVVSGNPDPVRLYRGQAAGNLLEVDFRAFEAYGGSVVGPSNYFLRGDWAMQASLGATSGTIDVGWNVFGDITADGGVSTPSSVFFVPVAFHDNLVNGGTLLLASTTGGSVSKNQLIFNSAVSISGQGWTIGPGNVLDGTISNSVSTGAGNRIYGNVINRENLDGAIVSNGTVAQYFAVAPQIAIGTCAIDGLVELYSKQGSQWSPIDLVLCASNVWESKSSALTNGTTIALLFTSGNATQTGPFSPPLTIR